jgi:7,8-dihydro-6-hydroxymethylpterin dimethyltransferase
MVGCELPATGLDRVDLRGIEVVECERERAARRGAQLPVVLERGDPLGDLDRLHGHVAEPRFADSSPELMGVATVDDVLANVDQRLAREGGQLDVLMLSGGEPTIHPQFEALLQELVQRDIVRIVVNTNGVRVARDDDLVALLEHHRDRVEIYLQFDGFRAETHRYHRNADLRQLKQQAVTRLRDARVFMTLTMTAALGVNDDGIGQVILYGLDTPFVGGISIQPQFASGRSGQIDPLARLTHTGVLARLEAQTEGLVSWRDLTALPCSHPHCCSVGYLIRTDDDAWRSLVAMIGHDRLKEHLDLVANRIADRDLPVHVRELVKQSLLGLLSEQTSLTHPTVTDLLRNICENCDLGLSTLLRAAGGALRRDRNAVRELVATRLERITIKPFMDINTMLEERLLQCCVHVGTRDDARDQCAPFCAVQAWAPLAEMKVPTVVARDYPDVLPLVPTRPER